MNVAATPSARRDLRPLLAGGALLSFAVLLLLFLNYAKFSNTLESHERARHSLLAEHLAKTLNARLALGLELEDTPVWQDMLTQELQHDARLHAIAALDAGGVARIRAGKGDPAMWQEARQAQSLSQPMPVHGDSAALAVGLRNGFGAEAGWLVLEYDLGGSHGQAAAAFSDVWPHALPALLCALLVLAVLAPKIARRHAGDPGRAIRRLSLLVAILLLLVQCVIAWSSYRAFTRVSSEDAPRLAATLAHTLTPGLERALEQGIPINELRGVEEWLRPALESGPEFALLAVEDPQGKRLFTVSDHTRSAIVDATTNATTVDSDSIRAYRFPLLQHGQAVGALVVALDMLPLAERTRQLAVEFATLLVIGVLISMEVLQGLLARAVQMDAQQALVRLRLPLFLFFAGSELPRAFLPMWSRQLSQQALPASWNGTVLATLFAPFANLPEAVSSTLPISLFLLTIALISPFAGRYSARHGPVRLLRFGLLLALLGHVLALLSGSLLSLCLARVLAGASSGFVTVAAFDYIGRGGAKARGMALYLAAYVAAGICGAGLGALLVDRAGTAAVFIVGLVCTLLAALTLWHIPAVERSAIPSVPLLNSLGQLMRQPRFVRLLALVGLPMQILQQGLLFYWAPLALTSQGEPTSFVGLTMMLYFFLVLLLNAPAARWADRSSRHAAIAVVGLAIAGAAGMFGGLVYTSGAIALSVGMIGVIWAAGFPAQGALVLRLSERELAGVAPTVAIGVYRMIERIGAMLAPPLIALMITRFGYADSAAMIGALLLCCALTQGWLLRQESRENNPEVQP